MHTHPITGARRKPAPPAKVRDACLPADTHAFWGQTPRWRAARIVRTPYRAALGSLITGAAIYTTGVLASYKAGTGQPWRSWPERTYLQYCEVCTRIEDFQSQPFRADFILDGSPATYLADCIADCDDGTTVCSEVKDRFPLKGKWPFDIHAVAWADLKEYRYARKLYAVGEILAELGIDFDIVVASRLHFPPVMVHNIDLVLRSRRITVEGCDLSIMGSALSVERPVAFGSLCDALGGGPAAIGKVCALHARRFLSIDFKSEIGPDSEVVPVIPRPGGRLVSMNSLWSRNDD